MITLESNHLFAYLSIAMLLKISCKHCGGSIEYDPIEFNNIVDYPCPHCRNSIRIIPPLLESIKPKGIDVIEYQRDKHVEFLRRHSQYRILRRFLHGSAVAAIVITLASYLIWIDTAGKYVDGEDAFAIFCWGVIFCSLVIVARWLGIAFLDAIDSILFYNSKEHKDSEGQ